MASPENERKVAMPTDKSDVFADIVDRLFVFERDLGLLDQHVLGVAYWPLIRLAVLNRIAQEHEVYANVSSLKAGHLPFRDRLTLLTRANPLLFLHRKKFVVVRGALQYRAGESRVDVYTDPLLDDLPPEDTEIVDLNPEGGIRGRPTGSKVSNAYTLNRLSAYTAAFLARTMPRTPAWKRASGELAEVERQLASRFRVDIPLSAIGLGNIIHFRAMHFAWKRYFRLRRPKVVILGIQSYGYQGLVRAAHEVGASVVEMQHGTVYRGHLGYHYPGRPLVPDVPDVFLTFGPAWHGFAEFPSNMQLRSFGFRALADARHRHDRLVRTKRRQIAILAADPFHAELAVGAARVLAAAPLNFEVKLRPHPADRFDYRAAIERIALPGIAFSEPTEPVYALLAESEYVVTGLSTTIFEAMYFGCKTIAMPLGYEDSLGPLIARTAARIVRNVDGLVAAMRDTPVPGPMPDFFDDRRPTLPEALAGVVSRAS